MDCKYARFFIIGCVWKQYYNNPRVLLLSLFYKILSSPISAGSPNITGQFPQYTWQNDVSSSFLGAFKSIGNANYKNGAWYWSGQQYVTHTYFDASDVSTIYGNSTTVTPESLATRWFIKF